jgi:DNA-binding CsgD family transcriptional regulator
MEARGALSAAELYAQTLSMQLSVLRAADGSRWYSAAFAVFATRDPVRLAVRDFGLTHRESQVLDLILHGSAPRDIAALLGVSLLTVHDHCRHLRQKTGSRSTTAMAASLLNGASCRSPGCIAQDAG